MAIIDVCMIEFKKKLQAECFIITSILGLPCPLCHKDR